MSQIMRKQTELTPRECEVRQHVLGGLTNAQIAVHLHLDIKTVESHIANIYAKITPPLRSRGPARRVEYLLRIFREG